MYTQETYYNQNNVTKRPIKRHNRIYSKTRFCIFIITMLVLVFITIGLLVNLESAAGLENHPYKIIKIKSGDTLWEIAESYVPEGIDVRDYIYAICDANEMESRTIYPDQELKLPIF